MTFWLFVFLILKCILIRFLACLKIKIMNKDWWEQAFLHLLFKLPYLCRCVLSVCLICTSFLGHTLLFVSGHALRSSRVPEKPSEHQEQTSFLHYAFLIIFNHDYFHGEVKHCKPSWGSLVDNRDPLTV